MISIGVTDNPRQAGRRCRPAQELKALLNAGALPEFVDISTPENNTDGLGNCHEAAMALMTDLIDAKQAARWKLVEGQVLNRQIGEMMSHSWLECDGWALDCANGHLLFVDRAAYRAMWQAREIVVRDAAATRWVRRLAASDDAQ
jgi:hypothetical protein